MDDPGNPDPDPEFNNAKKNVHDICIFCLQIPMFIPDDTVQYDLCYNGI